MWASDDRLGTFIAGHPNAPPLAEDIYKLRLLDQEDEQSAEDQQQSGEVNTTVFSMHVGDCRMSVLAPKSVWISYVYGIHASVYASMPFELYSWDARILPLVH